MLTVEDVREILSVPLLGIIPESESVLRASNTGMPVIFDEQSPAGRAYSDAVARFLGEKREMRFAKPERRSLFRACSEGHDGHPRFFFPRRAPPPAIAKERLQIVLAHERAGRDAPDFLPRLQRELLAVVGRYVAIKDDLIRVKLGRHSDASVLEINIEFDPAKPAAKPVAPPPPSTRATRPRGKAAIRRH